MEVSMNQQDTQYASIREQGPAGTQANEANKENKELANSQNAQNITPEQVAVHEQYTGWRKLPRSVTSPPDLFVSESGTDWLIGILDSRNWGGGLSGSRNHFELYDYIDRGEITFSQQPIPEVECPRVPPIKVHGRESAFHRSQKYSAWLWMRSLSKDAESEAPCAYGSADVYSKKLRATVEVGNCPADRIFKAMAAGYAWLIVWPLWDGAVPIKFMFSEAGAQRCREEDAKYNDAICELIRATYAPTPTERGRA